MRPSWSASARIPPCADRVTAELDDYEEVRAKATRFLLVPGHAQPHVEQIVESTPEFDVVEKFGAGGAPRSHARSTREPRS